MRFAARNDSLDAESLKDFFERTGNDTAEPRGGDRSTLTVIELVRAELLLYLTAICATERQEAVLTTLTDEPYFTRRDGIPVLVPFGAIYNVSDEFRRAYNRIRGREYKYPESEWLQERATLASVTFAQWKEADLLLTIKSRIVAKKWREDKVSSFISEWDHPTAGYWGRGGALEMFVRWVSHRVLERWMPYFHVGHKAELQKAIRDALTDEYRHITNGWGSLESDLSISKFGAMR